MHDFLQINIPKSAIVFFSRTTTMNRLVIKPARWYSTYICCERLLVHFLKLGHDRMFAVFALITAPNWAQLVLKFSEFCEWRKNSLICRHFQLGSVGRNRKLDHIASGTVIMLTTEPNWWVGVSCSQFCSVVSSFKPVGRCDRGLTLFAVFVSVALRSRSADTKLWRLSLCAFVSWLYLCQRFWFQKIILQKLSWSLIWSDIRIKLWW